MGFVLKLLSALGFVATFILVIKFAEHSDDMGWVVGISGTISALVMYTIGHIATVGDDVLARLKRLEKPEQEAG